MKDIIILGIESSCDETAASVIKNGRDILSSEIYSQIDIHRKYGGVVPEIASRAHTEKIDVVVIEALNKANVTLNDIDAIAVTKGPGLIGALLVGISFGKSLAYSNNIPLIGVNHIDGHVSANYLAHCDLEPPFISLVASGGHASLIKVIDYGEYEILGVTRDDAPGEAFDKIARSIGLPYPGGPKLSEMARDGDDTYYNMPKVEVEGYPLDFSFSGIKSHTLNIINKEKMQNRDVNKKNLCASFERAVCESLVDRMLLASEITEIKKVSIGGGVASNTRLRKMMEEKSKEKGLTFYKPEKILCTDNGAMIGAAGYYKYLKGEFESIKLNGVANLKL